VQQQFGESLVATVHFACAAVFILSLAAMCFLFARREQKWENDRKMVRFQYACGAAILAAVAWVAIGGLLKATVWEITPLYLGEVVAVWAFGASWLAKGKNLRSLLRGRPQPAAPAATEPAPAPRAAPVSGTPGIR
jgi:hypothetical protein